MDVIDWLLESPTPTVRYLTRRDLLHVESDDPSLQHDRAAIMTDGPVPRIFAAQTESGQWADEHSYYTPKYTSSHWRMTMLAELHADPDDPRFQRGAQHMLDTTADWLAKDDDPKTGFECLWGNMLRYLAQARLLGDPRAQIILDFVARNAEAVRFACPHNAGLSCAWGAARVLWGLASIPEAQRTAPMNTTIDRCIDFLLNAFNLELADYPGPDPDKPTSPYWFKLNVPLFYQADILVVLRTLAELDRLDHPGAQNALAWLRSRQQKNGRWRGTSPFKSRMGDVMGDRDEVHRWATLYAMTILEHAPESTNST